MHGTLRDKTTRADNWSRCQMQHQELIYKNVFSLRDGFNYFKQSRHKQCYNFRQHIGG